jgi:hypothetical protein
VTTSTILSWAEGIAQQYAAKISKLLGVPAEDVTFRVGTTMGDRPAETSGTTITLNRKWFTQHPDDSGAIVHEMVHAFQQIPGGTVPDKRVEAFADALRIKLGLTYEGWEPSAQAQRLAALSPEKFRQASQKVSGSPAPTTAAKPEGQEKQVFKDNAGNYYINDGGNIVRVTEEEAAKYVAGTLGEPGSAAPSDFVPPNLTEAGLTDEEKRAKIIAERNAKAYFLGQIGSLGIGLNGNLNQLVEQAVNRGYDAEAFLYYLRQTPEYAKAFPGILNKDGSMKMSEAQYLSNVSQYQSIAAQAGINLGKKQTTWLFQNDVSVAEYAVKAPAVARIKRDPQLFRAFGREVVQGGLAKPGETDLQGLLRFAAGMGNRAWYDLWQDTVTRNAAVNAGIAVKTHGQTYARLGQQLLEKISSKGLSEEQMTAGFQDLGEHLLTTLPQAKLQGYGLTREKLATAEFGGPGAAQIRQTVKRVAEQEQAFYEPRAGNALQTSERGGIQTAGRGTTASTS